MHQVVLSALALSVPALALAFPNVTFPNVTFPNVTLPNVTYPNATYLNPIYSPNNSTNLPPCSENVRGACQCPNGTYFGNHTTYGLIGARPKDVSDILADCEHNPFKIWLSAVMRNLMLINGCPLLDFRTDWVELPLVNSSGRNGEIGTVRTLQVNRSNGSFFLSMVVSSDWLLSPMVRFQGADEDRSVLHS